MDKKKYYYDEEHGDILPEGNVKIEVFRKRNGEYDGGFITLNGHNVYIEKSKNNKDYEFVGRYIVPSRKARAFFERLLEFSGREIKRVRYDLKEFSS